MTVTTAQLTISCGLSWKIDFIPLQVENGQPKSVFFELRVYFEHPTGYFEYVANDASLTFNSFEQLAYDLDRLAKNQVESCTFSSVGDMFSLAFHLNKKSLKWIPFIHIHIREYQPFESQAELLLPIFLPDIDSLERIQRTVVDYLRILDEWIEMNY